MQFTLEVIDAAVVGDQHQVVARALAGEGFGRKLTVAVSQPAFTGHGLAENEVCGLAGSQLGAAVLIGSTQAQLLQALTDACRRLATGDGDPARVVQARAGGAVAAFGVANHHDHRPLCPILQQPAVAQLLLVAKVHDVRPRRKPGGQPGQHQQQACCCANRLARVTASFGGVCTAGFCKVLLGCMLDSNDRTQPWAAAFGGIVQSGLLEAGEVRVKIAFTVPKARRRLRCTVHDREFGAP